MNRQEFKEIIRERLKTESLHYVREVIKEVQEEEILKKFGLKVGNVVESRGAIGIVNAKRDELHWRKLKKDNSPYAYETYLASSYALGTVKKIAETYEEYLETLNK